MLSKWEIPLSCWKACFPSSIFDGKCTSTISNRSCPMVFSYVQLEEIRGTKYLYWLWIKLSCPILGHIYVFIFQSVLLCPSITSINILNYFTAKRTHYSARQRKKKKKNKTTIIKDIPIAIAVVWVFWKDFLPHKSVE